MLEICFLEVRQGRLEQAGNGLQDTACKMAYVMPFCLDTVHGYFGKDNNARISYTRLRNFQRGSTVT